MAYREILNILVNLLNNGLILLGLVFLYAATNFDPQTNTLRKKITAGITIGISSIFIMANPWKLDTGLIFDTRSVLFGVNGFFFGGIPTVIAAVIGSAYRIWVGGAGVYAGVATILSTSALGYLWKKYRKPEWFNNNAYFEFYALGVVLHIATLLGFFLIPNGLNIIINLLIPYLGLFPILVMLIGVVILNQQSRLHFNQEFRIQTKLLQASMDATRHMEIYALDRNFKYLTFNHFHQVSMKAYYNLEIHKGEDFLSIIENDAMKRRLMRNIQKALDGVSHIDVVRVEIDGEKYLEEHYAPIIEDGNIIGATIFSYEITDRKKYEASILYLSYNDALTGLYNRRFYSEKLAELKDTKYNPVSIILCDINGLKIMNDAFGHAAGDELLIEVSALLKQIFNDKGSVCRIGGDEFVVLLPNTPLHSAQYYLEKMKRILDKKYLHGMSVSVSFGVSCRDQDGDLEEVIRVVEEQMYKNKLFEVTSHRSESIKTILNTLHEKNPREERHSKRVSEICINIGRKLGMKSENLQLLRAISNLHDIGKIAIDEAILNKPGKLTEAEWEIIKRHPEIGYRIISTSPEYAEIAYDILSHHEKWDGTGYPRGIEGENIPIRARIISIADAYDAMVSERPYRKPLSHEEAIAEIKKHTGKQFDPSLVEVFLSLYEKQ